MKFLLKSVFIKSKNNFRGIDFLRFRTNSVAWLEGIKQKSAIYNGFNTKNTWCFRK